MLDQRDKYKRKDNSRLIILAGMSVILLLAMISVWLWNWYSINTITLEDLQVKSCDQLPNFRDIDTTFVTNKINISSFLDDLGRCENNMFVCNRFSTCLSEDYPKHKIRSGNTIVEWKSVAGCDEKKALS